MKILHTVEFYPPSVGGMQEVVRQLSERLAAHGHEVTVATTRLPGRRGAVLNGVRIAEFAVSGKLATGMAGEVEEYRRFVLESDFDVITSFAAQQWATDALLGRLDRIRAKKVFVPTGFSELNHPRFQGYFAAMPGWMNRYDMNVFLSADYRDINFARDHGVEKVMVIPNGAAEDEFLAEPDSDIRALLGIPRGHFLILHVGSHTGLKGHAEAMRIFAGARIENATLLIVANDTGGGCATSCAVRKGVFNAWPRHRADNKRILVTPLSRVDTVAAYQSADLFLFPSNIECSPLVLFECLASRTPFLATDAGNAGEIAAWSDGGLLLPTDRDAAGRSRARVTESARLLEEVCRDRAGRERMAECGFGAWRECFTWEKIARDYEALYLALLRGERP
jgi:glycosyltransferase involved in cell wall biosynthesis